MTSIYTPASAICAKTVPQTPQNIVHVGVCRPLAHVGQHGVENIRRVCSWASGHCAPGRGEAGLSDRRRCGCPPGGGCRRRRSASLLTNPHKRARGFAGLGARDSRRTNKRNSCCVLPGERAPSRGYTSHNHTGHARRRMCYQRATAADDGRGKHAVHTSFFIPILRSPSGRQVSIHPRRVPQGQGIVLLKKGL